MAPVLFLSGEEHAVYEVVPSLGQISAVKIAATLWNREDVRTLIRPPYGWTNAEEKVRHYAQLLLLTEQIKVVVLKFTKIIGDEIHAWMKRYGYFTLPKHLYWTAFGSLDITKTALSLVSDPHEDLRYRYELACTFCLESYVIELWNQLPDRHEDDSCISIATSMPTAIWTHAMKTKGTLGNSFENLWSDIYFRVLMELPRHYNKAAVEYFLPKLSLPVRAEFLEKAVWHCVLEAVHFAGPFGTTPNDLVFFLLSQIDTDQRTSYLQSFVHLVLIRCLIWPWQTVFMPVAKLLEPLLSNSLCMHVFNGIIKKVSQRAEDYNYQQLFTEFWEQSPETRKRYVIQRLALCCDLLFKLFTAGDRDNITLILQDATAEEQDKIVSYYGEYFHAMEFSGYSLFSEARDERLRQLFLEYLLKEVRKKSG